MKAYNSHGFDLICPQEVVDGGRVEGIKGHLPLDDYIAFLGGEFLDDFRPWGTAKPCTFTPIGYHVDFNPTKAVVGRTADLQLGETWLERVEGHIEDLGHFSSGPCKQLLKVCDDMAICKLFLDVGIHSPARGEEVILG